MYCKYCGEFNEDGSVFCCECGKNIGHNQEEPYEAPYGYQPQNTYQQPGNAYQQPQDTYISLPSAGQIAAAGKNAAVSAKKILPLIIVIACLIAAVIAAVIAGNWLTSPDRTAEKYFKSLSGKDWASAYDCLYLNESEFINAEQFALMMENSEILPDNIVAYEIISESDQRGSYYDMDSIADSDFQMEYRVNYATERSSSERMDIKLIKTSEKQFLFFDSYKVSASEFIGEMMITVPAFASVSVDGVLLDDTKLVSSSEYSDTYEISSVFQYPHAVLVQSPVTEDYELSVQNEITVSPYHLKLKQDAAAALAAQAESDFAQLSGAAAAGNTLDPSDPLSVSYSEYFLEPLYNSAPTGMHNLAFYEFTVDTEESGMDDTGYYKCVFSFRYTYDNYYYDSVRTDNGWEDVLTSEPRENDGYGVFRYSYDNGSWNITDISNVQY